MNTGMCAKVTLIRREPVDFCLVKNWTIVRSFLDLVHRNLDSALTLAFSDLREAFDLVDHTAVISKAGLDPNL